MPLVGQREFKYLDDDDDNYMRFAVSIKRGKYILVEHMKLARVFLTK